MKDVRIPGIYLAEDLYPQAHTVGRLKRLLASLPDNLEIKGGIELSVSDYGRPDECIHFRAVSKVEWVM